jgi:hypothetical protein
MPLTRELRIEIQEIRDGDIQQRAEQLSNWLHSDKKETFDEIMYFITLQNDLINNLTRELADLRKEKAEPEKKFFPMSKSSYKRR